MNRAAPEVQRGGSESRLELDCLMGILARSYPCVTSVISSEDGDSRNMHV